MLELSTFRRPTKLDLVDDMAAQLARMVARCTKCTVLVMCEPCHTADCLLAHYDRANA